MHKTIKVNWEELTTEEWLNALIEASYRQPQLIFKHSTRCNLSSRALHRLEKEWEEGTPVTAHLLDLLAYRSLSNLISERLDVTHESPQAILIKNGVPAYHASHHKIKVADITNSL